MLPPHHSCPECGTPCDCDGNEFGDCIHCNFESLEYEREEEFEEDSNAEDSDE